MSQTHDEPTRPRWERAIEGMFRGMWEWGVLFCLIAVALGLALWPLTDVDSIHYIVKNDLSVVQRSKALLAVAISAVVTTVGYLLVWLRARRREPGLGVAESFRRTNHYAFVMLALPMMTALGVVRIETKHPVFTAFLSVMITGLVMLFLYRVFKRKLDPGHEPFQPARSPRAALAFFVAALLGYAALMTYYALIDHHNLGTAIYDLGIYDNLVWQTAHGFFLDCSLIKGGNHVSAHFDPIIALIALVYRLYMHAETLLVLQTLWLASGAIPVYLLAKRRLSNEWFAAILGLIYLLYPALHGVNMFDFHSLAFVVPSAMWAVYLLDTGGFKRYWLVIALMLITREDISLLNCFVGAYAIMIGRTRTGLVTVAVSMVYLVLVKMYAMADSGLLMSADKAYSYVYYYAEMIPHKAEGTRGLAISALTNPLYALLVSFKEEKLLFFLHLLLPLLCLPFAAGKKLILSVYGLLFIGLASRSHVFSLHFQYSALLFPMLFAAVPDGLRRVTDGPRIRALGIERAPLAWTLLFGMLTASLVTTVKYGVIIPNASFKTGWNRLVRVPTPEMRERHAWVEEIAATIEPGAAVSMTSAVGPHLSNRRKAYHWPTINDADYLVLTVENFKKDDERRLKRIRDKKQFRLVKEAHGIALYARIDDDEAAGLRATEAAEKAAERARRKTGGKDATGTAGVEPAATATAGAAAATTAGTAPSTTAPTAPASTSLTSPTRASTARQASGAPQDSSGAGPSAGSAPAKAAKPAAKPALPPKETGSGAPSP
jgi:uncharacterized membrane protein